MKNRAGLLIIMFFLSLLSIEGSGQQCVPVSKSNNIKASQLCSPVDVLYWDVSYSGVDPSVAKVEIFIDWDDGFTETLPTDDSAGRVFYATGIHTYVSQDDKCNYKPTATMVVDGTLCTSQWQEQIVTIWDVDNENGAYVNASPDVYPICVGNSATVRFDDDTKYNCVPPQEEDNRNESTRWIQWVYRNKSMTGTPVSVDGYTGPWPYATPVKTLKSPSWGSDEQSLPIYVDDDKLIGQEFEVELRYWNYCNKYTDPDSEPVIDKSVIRVVGNPDPTIDPLDFVCEFGGELTMTAAQSGGTWSGPGIIDADAGLLLPSLAGTGIHTIHHEIIDENGCSASANIDVEVSDGPDGTITPVDPVCYGADPFNMETLTIPGTWSGSAGITNPTEGTFSSDVAGPGSHEITYQTAPDADGCRGADTTLVHVVIPPFAAFLTPDSAWCQRANNSTMATIAFFGLDTSKFDLVYETRGRSDTLFNMPADTFDLFLNNTPGENLYILKKVIEHHGASFCETELNDTLKMTVNAIMEMDFTMIYDDLCSPVEVEFVAPPNFKKYTWDFGDGQVESTSLMMQHTFTFDHTDIAIINDQDTIYDLSRMDSVFNITLLAESYDGCNSFITKSLPVYPVPEVYFLAYPEIQNHPDSIINLTNLTSVGNWNYLWSFGDELLDFAKDPGAHDYDIYGIYDIELKAYNNYCRDSMTRRIQILPPPPSASFFPDTVGCSPLEVNFDNGSQYADSYMWDFDDNRFSTEPNPTHTFYQSREYHVKLEAIGLSGIDSSTRIIYVYEQPVADFTAYPNNSKNLKQIFKFVNNSVGGSSYLWDFGDGNTSPDEEPSHIYEDSGTYSVSLYVWSDQNCPDTLVQKNMINVQAGEGSIKFPNVFAWNGSGPTGGHWTEGTIDNTVFHPAVINATTFRMIIYNRWGEELFESNDLYIGWDGYLKGAALATEGVYLFKAWVKYVDGYEEILAGDITFLH